jgi:hypothetical protein
VGSAEIKAIIGMTIHFNAATVAHDKQCFTLSRSFLPVAKIITSLIAKISRVCKFF